MNPDIVNGLFELCGGAFLLFNCWKTYLAKMVRGVSILSTAFFASWGLWNLFYYPHLDQWWSFTGGLVIVSANALWISMMIYYTQREKRQGARLRAALSRLPDTCIVWADK